MPSLWGRPLCSWESALSEEDWRLEERYAGLRELTAPALAWEFLRRNSDYQADYRRIQSEVASGGTARAGDARLARWGLTFRRRSGAPGNRTAGLLAA
jgi:hypothetical protein